jgi:PAS domain S-box-containing protein
MLALIVLAGLLFLWSQASTWYRGQLLANKRVEVGEHLISFRNTLTIIFSSNFARLDGLKAFVEASPSGPLDEHFELFAEGLYLGESEIRNLILAPGGVNRFVYPLAGNEAAVGHNLLTDPRPEVGKATRQAIETRSLIVTQPYELLQGGQGFVARQPVFIDGKFWGIVSIALDMPSLIEDAGLNARPASLEIALRDQTGNVFYGQNTVFDNDPVLYTIPLPHGYWELAGYPSSGWNASIQRSILFFRLGGLIIVILLSTVIYAELTRRTRLERAVQERSTELAHEVQERRQAEEKLEKQNRRLQILREIDTAILSAQSIEAIVDAALSHIRELIACRRAALTLIDWERNEALLFDVKSEEETSIPQGTRLPLTNFPPIWNQHLDNGQPVLVNDMTTLPDLPPAFLPLVREGLRSLCILPLFSQSGLIGTFGMFSEIPAFFSKEKISLGYEVANQVAIALAQNRLVDALKDINLDLEQRLVQLGQAETALRESEARHRSISEIISDYAYSFRVEADGTLTREWVTDSYLRLFSHGAQTSITEVDLMSVVHPDDRSVAQRAFQNLFESAEPVSLEYRIFRGKDEIRWLHSHAHAIWDESHTHIVQVVGAGQDITERKQAELALRESEARLTSMIDSAMDAIISINADQQITVFNTAAEQMLLCPAEEAIGQPLDRFLPDRFRARHPGQVHALGSSGAVKRLPGEIDARTVTGRKADGTEFPAEVSISYTESAGQPLYTVILRDVTERKRAEEKIQRQIDFLTGLQDIGHVIISTSDMHLSLSLLVSRTASLLGVDAVTVLLINPVEHTLEYAAGLGFRTDVVKTASIKLNQSYAGKVILEQRMIQIQNLTEEPKHLFTTGFLKDEDFVSYYGTPLIVKGKVIGVLEVFHRSAVERNQEWFDFFNTLASQASLAIDNARLFRDLQISNTELILAYEATIEGWSRALDLRDRETEGHTLRVTEKTLELARHMRFSDDELLQVRRGTLLHDIGKMGVPDSILLKADSLSEQEVEIMRRHPVFAFELLSPIRYLKSAAIDIPYCHHEKWDGTGYPRGLKGEQIPLAARIFAVIDVWDALTSDRPYRKAWSARKASEYIRDQAGKHFDPEVVRVFFLIV